MDGGMHVPKEDMLYLVVRAGSKKEIEAYLPANFRVSYISNLPDGKVDAVVEGYDMKGWTMADYVIPRLQSGNIWGTRFDDYMEAREAATSAMN
jgi:hypothetical protein